MGRCSTNCGTVPLFVELFHKKWNCSTLCRSSWILPRFVTLQEELSSDDIVLWEKEEKVGKEGTIAPLLYAISTPAYMEMLGEQYTESKYR